MGMRVPSGGASVQGNVQAWQQRKQSMQALSQALSAGNLDAAKKAYASLTGNGGNKAASNPNSPIGKLGQALQNGDLAGAQKALSQMKSANGHHQKAGAASGSQTAPTTGTAGGIVNTYV